MIVSLIWTLIFLGASAFSFYNLREAMADAAALRKSRRNGPYSRVARGTIRVEASRLIAFSFYVLIGILALLNNLPGALFQAVMLLGGVCMLFNTAVTYQTRKDVLRLGDEGHHAGAIAEQPSPDRQAQRVVRGTGRGRLGAGTKQKNRNAANTKRRGSR